MTTYFYRNPDGSEYSHVLHNVAPVYLATALVPGSALEPHWQRIGVQPTAFNNVPGDDLDEDATAVDDKWHETDDSYCPDSADSPPGASYIGDTSSPWYGMMGTHLPGVAQYGGNTFKYPDPDLIRDFHSLHSLLPYIQPARLRNAACGPKLDIVEEGTDHTFAVAVPKKMLALFCGRKFLNRFLRTLEREDNTNWEGGPVAQQLCFPRHHTNHIGVKIVVSWMHRACRTPKNEMKQIQVPKNLFAAVSLSRALTTFGLHRDANRLDHLIASHHYKRPLYPDEIASIWTCLPKDNKYTYRMVEDLRRKLSEHESGDTKSLPDAEKVLKFLEQHPELTNRIKDKDYNNSKKFRPFFGTEWCERAARRTQQTLAGLVSMEDGTTSKPEEWNYEIAAPQPQGGYHGLVPQYKDVKQGPVQSRKHVAALSNREESKSSPTAWPQFKKPIVLKIVESQEKEHGDSCNRTDSVYGSDGKSLQL
jgi:hypothetical protein